MAESDPTSDADPLVTRWISEIDASERWQREYITRCRSIVKRYRDERKEKDNQPDQDKKKYPILWSNLQTLAPAVYARAPEAVVTRRYKDSDPIGRYASEVLERAINFSCSEYPFDDRMKLCRDDYLLIGRSTAWIRYVPHMGPVGDETPEDPQLTSQAEDEGSAEEKQVYAEVVVDHVSFDDFGYTPCREWAEVWYAWRRVFMDKGEVTERFGEKIANSLAFDWEPKNDGFDDETKTKGKKAAVYEVWDKRKGEVLWISKSYPTGPLDQREDWLGLEGFFPFPRPLFATTPQDKLIPVPDFIYYQDQAEELDELTAKIGLMVDALKVAGFYAGEENIKLQNLFSSQFNQLVPIDSMAQFQDKGGFKGLIEWFPLDQTILALKTAFETRKEILEDIYQITGISDIIRGASDPEETATAQGIKSQWGSIRVRDKQAELARFARDIMRIKGEIIAKQFTPETLAAMTDVQLPTDAQKALWARIQAAQGAQAGMVGAPNTPPSQGQAPQASQPIPGQLGQSPQPQAQAPQPAQTSPSGAPPPPPLPPGFPSPEILSLPSWEDVNRLLKNDALRSFRVDIETDATIQPDENEEKQRRVEFTEAMGSLLGQALPAIQAYPPLAPLIAKTVEFLARGFRVGREMEDVIEKTFDNIAKMPAQPQGGQQGQTGPSAGELILKQQELELKRQELAMTQQQEQQRIALDAQSNQAEQQRTQADYAAEIARLRLDERQQMIDQQEAQANRQHTAQVAALRPPPKVA